MKLRASLALVVALTLITVAGCPKPPKPAEQGGVPPVAGQGEEQQSRSLVYRWPLPADPRSLDPAKLTDTVSDTVCRRIFNTLVKFRPDGAIVPDLAESYEISTDGLVYTFKLHADPAGQPAVKFHNGDIVDAEAVAYSLRRVLDPATASARASLLYYVAGARDFHGGKSDAVSGIEVVDPLTLRLTLDKPYAPFINVLCMTVFSAVPRTEVESNPDGFGDNPVGSGPFVFSKWEREQSVELKSNRDYFGTEATIQTLIFRVVKDEKTRFEEFKAGNLEHCDIPPSQMQEVLGDPKLKDLVQGEQAMDMYSFGFNCSEPPFKDNTALRQAFNHAVDKGNIASNIWGGLVTEQKTFVPKGMFYFWDDAPGYAYDPDKARQLLAAAGYPEGQGLPELTLNIDLQPTNKLVAEAVQEDLRSIGVKVNIKQTDWSQFLDKIYAGEALFHQNTWLTDYPDPDNWLWQLLHSANFGESGNTTRWSNSEFDQLVEAAQVEPDQARRTELYAKAEQIAYDEAPWLFVLWKNSATLVQPYVQGLSVSRLDRTPHLGNTPIEEVSFSD